MSLGLSASDFSTLSLSTGVSVEVLARRLVQNKLSEFKTTELKEIIRFFKTHPLYVANNPFVNPRVTGPLSQAKKAAQAEALRKILDFQLHPPSANGTAAPGAAASNSPAASGSGMGSNAQMQQQQQAAYRLQQQQQQRFVPPQESVTLGIK